ncbi:hypothetical protein EfmAA96_28140 [Enterococcus faecium]|nr:hypothetical protein EfmAA96_28140 [Enterococcus faecium]
MGRRRTSKEAYKISYYADIKPAFFEFFCKVDVLNLSHPNDFTSNSISKGTGINLSTIKKLKSGERSVEKLNLLDAIKITEFAMKNGKAEIEIWR